MNTPHSFLRRTGRASENDFRFRLFYVVYLILYFPCIFLFSGRNPLLFLFRFPASSISVAGCRPGSSFRLVIAKKLRYNLFTKKHQNNSTFVKEECFVYQFPEASRKLYEAMRVPMAAYQYIDGKAVPLLVSDGLCLQMGIDREKLMERLTDGKYDTLHPDDAGRIVRASEGFAQHKFGYNVFFRSKHADGYHAIHSTGYWQTMPDGTEIAFLSYQDLSSAKEDIEKAAEDYGLYQRDHFYRDPVTGLPNINYMQEFADGRIHSLRVDGKKPALIYSDVNSMQFYNNQYGFSKGNELLCFISETLESHFPGALLARGADDHFLLLWAYEGEEDLRARMVSVNREIRSGAVGNTTGIQAGVVVIENEMDFTEAVDHAKNALKRIGSDLNRSYRIYSRLEDAQYWNQRYIVENLDRAIEEKWIRVFYQGICRIRTEKTAAFEALARWNDPSRGSISPADFIPVLEKYHLLYKLDLYMVKQVFLELPERLSAGLPLLPVSVNFAAQDFDYKNIPEEIEYLYHSTGADQLIPRNHLIVEITERDMATASDKFEKHLKTLREMGYQLWLDDFGSGYSSLNVFSRFEVDLIKFDMALIQHLDDRSGINRKIIRAMASIAHSMGIQTLAEGLETEEQKEFLVDSGCDLAQGFLFRRPIPLDSILYIVRGGSYVQRCETEAERQRFRLEDASGNA